MGSRRRSSTASSGSSSPPAAVSSRSRSPRSTVPPRGAREGTLDFYVDLFNNTVEGLDESEIWVHTCWGNPGAQHCFDPNISYENSIDIFLNRLNADVWTIESKDADHRPLALFEPYKGKLERRSPSASSATGRFRSSRPKEIAADVRRALEDIGPEHLVLSSDCGFGRQGVPRPSRTTRLLRWRSGPTSSAASSVRSRPRLWPPICRCRSTSRRSRRRWRSPAGRRGRFGSRSWALQDLSDDAVGPGQ